MRSKICIVPLLAVLALYFLAGCAGEDGGQTTSTATNGTIGVLLFSDEVDPDNELDGTVTAMKGVWNWQNGTFQWEDTPQITLSGPGRMENFLSWDGGERYFVLDATGAAAQTDTAEIISYLEDWEDGASLLWGPGYQVEVTGQGQCTVNQDGAEPVLVENLDPGLAFRGETVALEDLSLFGGTLEEGKLTLVYGRLADQAEDSDSILSVAIDLHTKETAWSSPVDIPYEYREGMFFDSYLYKPMLDSKLYVSTGESVAYFDRETTRFVELSTLPGEIETLLPGVQRDVLSGKSFAANPIGSTEEVVVASFCYHEEEPQIFHVVYAALEGDQVVGFLDQRQEDGQCIITIYDAAAHQTDQVQVPNISLATRFQTQVSPLPF